MDDYGDLLPPRTRARGFITLGELIRLLDARQQCRAEDRAVLPAGELAALREELSRQRIAVRLGGYDLDERIGRGSMSVVYRARSAESGVVVAIKLLLATLAKNPECRDRFAHEARCAMRLNHPNLARVIGFGEDSGVCFIVMEYARGESLGQLIRARGRLPEKDARKIGRDIARALEALEEAGIVHGDIKPGNIICAESGETKLADFSVARESFARAGTNSAPLPGTPAYMAPELAARFLERRAGTAADTRADIYALGATLYHACVGEPPFRGATPEETMRLHLTAIPSPARSVNPGISQSFSDLIARMLARNPAQRHSSARELIAAFGE